MGAVIGGLLPFAVGVALSPTAVMVGLLLAAEPRTRAGAVGFVAGWIAGVAAAVIALTAVSAALPDVDDASGSKPLIGVAKIVTGLVMVILAVARRRMSRHARPGPPRWTTMIDRVTAGRAVVLGTAMSWTAKNLMMAASAGLVIGAGAVGPAGAVIAVAAYTALATTTVWVPVLSYLGRRRRMRRSLDAAKDWVTRNSATVMSIVLLVIGVSQIGSGLELL